jgi:hypothetical protein
MLGWVVDVVVTFALSLASACYFLRLRSRRVGPPFGPRARYWASPIVAAAAMVSTGVGMVIVAASGTKGGALAGIAVPSGLWLGRASAPRGGVQDAWQVWPLSRLYEAMGEDMENWRTTRLTAASHEPQWISDAVQYYASLVERKVKDDTERSKLRGWRESIVQKIRVVRLINLDTTAARVQAAMQSHAATKRMGVYAGMNFERLAERLMSDAKSELNLYLDCIYHLGYHKLLIYPFRPGAHR